MQEITFIHGVGNGTLRHQIHKQLSQMAEQLTFKDAQKEKFGYGATKVVFK
jgi:dsDNA-specific endonuclease/ATPase MutS2